MTIPCKCQYWIDYLYDSRIDGSAQRISTAGLTNQVGAAVGAAEIAALNRLIGSRAPSGSAGSPTADAAIALIIRQVMGDGIRSDGTVVYPPGLKIYGAVQSLPGGTPAGILDLAQRWWIDASYGRGPWHVSLEPVSPAVTTPLGTPVSYRVRVLTPDDQPVTSTPVTFTCSGPITCPDAIVSAADARTISVTPRGLGPYAISATITGPSGDGQLLVSAWSSHAGPTARNNGVQRGWIAQQVSADATARGAAEAVKATPVLVTKAQPTAVAGDSLSDEVTITGVPEGYVATMLARLYGPFAEAPGADSCTPDALVGQVEVRVGRNETLRTPEIAVSRGGYYTWTESLPEEESAEAVLTPCGIAEETTRVLDRPQLRTTVSDARVFTPGEVFDTIEVSGVSGAPIDIEWSLLGPILPGDHSCADLDWTDAPVRATGQVQSADGSVRTRPVSITVAGCYTYREHSDAIETAVASDSPAGLPEETFLATLPPLRIVPEVPTGAVTMQPWQGWLQGLLGRVA